MVVALAWLCTAVGASALYIFGWVHHRMWRLHARLSADHAERAAYYETQRAEIKGMLAKHDHEPLVHLVFGMMERQYGDSATNALQWSTRYRQRVPVRLRRWYLRSNA